MHGTLLINYYSSGGSGATTIKNNHDIQVAVTALLKKKKDCSVGADFDLNHMEEFCICKCVCI